MSEKNSNNNKNTILEKQIFYQDLFIKDIDDELENLNKDSKIKENETSLYSQNLNGPASLTPTSIENTNSSSNKQLLKAVCSDRSLTCNDLNVGASTNNFNDNNETYFKTQPSEEDESNKNSNLSKIKFKVPLIKLNEFSTTNGKYIDEDCDYNQNEFNGIKLKQVTNDHSKDYTSESSSQGCSDHEDNNQHHRNIKRMFRQNDQNEEEKTNKNNDFNVSMIAPLNDSANSSLNENQENIDSNKNKSQDDSPSKTRLTSPNLDIFKLLNKNSKKFILKPSTLGLTIKSQIFRQKGLYPQYRYYIENLDGNLLLIMTARQKKKSKTHCYVINSISFDLNNIYKYIETPIAKLKSNLLGTQFVLYDFGIKPKSLSSLATERSNSSNGDSSELSEESQNKSNNDPCSNNDAYSANRREYAFISYELNLLGIKGPRAMTTIIPGMDKDLNRDDFILKNEYDSLQMAWKQIDFNLKNKTKLSAASTPKKSLSSSTKKDSLSPSHELYKPPEVLNSIESDHGDDNKSKKIKSTSALNNTNLSKPISNVVKLVNKSPEWHKEINSFALNFNGRVTKSSSKNFQIIHETNTDYIIMQFGKVDRDLYTCDYSYPLCALQAFSIAITSLDNKLGCD